MASEAADWPGRLGGKEQVRHRPTETVSFEQVFVQQKDFVYRLTLAMLGDQAEAEDAVQEIFMRVYKALDRYDPKRAKLSTWLYRIAVNYCQSCLRRRRVQALFWQQNQPDQAVQRNPIPDQFETRRIIWQSIDQLGEKHRIPLILHYYLDMSAPEIATVLQIREGTVYSRLHTARRRLRGKLEWQDISPSEL